MEYFTGLVQEQTQRPILAILVSTAFHILSILLVVLLPMLGSRSIHTDDIVDVTLLDFAMPDMGSDILPAAATAVEEEKNVEPPKPAPKEELVDPSEAELIKMKKRTENRTPPPKPAEDEFAMQTGILPGGGGETKGSMRIDAKDFPFYFYLAMMKNKVSENWIPPFGSFEEENKRVVIAFRIERSGKLLSSSVEETSGDPLLDQSALRAVVVSSPFPPLPEGYNDSSLGVHFGFICKL